MPALIPILALLLTVAQAPAPPSPVADIIASPSFERATAALEADQERFVRELILLTEIPAPPFKEKARAAKYLGMLRESGLTDVEMDAEGNVMGLRRGTGGGGLLAVMAHLDTVFPEGTPVKVRRDGTRLMAPGVGDDTRGLATMLSVIRAMDAGRFQTAEDVLFVGNVGEEGEGDLRGTKFLLEKGKYKDRITELISIDGGNQAQIVNGALGSRRYRVTFSGPGGHSYGAFGLVSPAFAMGKAISRFSETAVPSSPRTTYNVGVVGGGTSVNSIPAETFMTVDMRSESRAELDGLVEHFKTVVADAVADENRSRSTAQGRIEAEIELIGDRPSGVTAVTTPLVQHAAAAVQSFGMTPRYAIGSTDANVPISKGIPALAIGHGQGGRAHALDEWVDVEPKARVRAAQVILALVLAAAG
jgi:tripeptide aminopeptidase